jgi:hypothetical protein
MPVVDAERRAKLCGARATTERTMFGACADCAAHHDARLPKGQQPMARELTPPPVDDDAALRAKWEQEQQKLPPHKRRTWEQALDGDEKRQGRALRGARKRGGP